ncbi:hypothetical protein E4U41_004950 [Claviceps citrina]|nr:hypothetical protein E4U41_004950 [Claviceps citrina]
MSLAADEYQSTEPIRVSKIAGRYLVFDPEAVAFLRRREHINGTLVGTTPQQPTQNVFLGLPIELRPEEVGALLHRKSAYVVDDVDAHNAALRSARSAAARRRYIASLRSSKQAAHFTLSQRSASKLTGRAARPDENAEGVNGAPSSCRTDEAHNTSTDGKTVQCDNQIPSVGHLAVTPVSSAKLVASVAAPQDAHASANPTLCGFLQSQGHYMTPGLRFGSKYSVYPGDPLRFHAHFMANEYDWEGQIPILDIVGGGRLATAVKKAFLVGGLDASEEKPNIGSIRTFSIEWAAM